MPSFARQDEADDESVPIGKAPKLHLHMHRRRSSRLAAAAAEPWDHRWGLLPGAAPWGVTVTEAAGATRQARTPRHATAALEQQQQQQQPLQPEAMPLRRHFSRPPPPTARKFAETAPLGEVIGALPRTPPPSHRAASRKEAPPAVAEWEGTRFHLPSQELRATLSRGSAVSDPESDAPPDAGAATPVPDADLPGWMPRPLVQQRKVCLSRDAMPLPLPEAPGTAAVSDDAAPLLPVSPAAAAPPALALVDHAASQRVEIV